MGKTAADGLKKDIIWNTLGSLIYALSSMVLAFIALRFAGPDDGGKNRMVRFPPGRGGGTVLGGRAESGRGRAGNG